MDNAERLANLRQRAGNIWQKLRLKRREPWNWCLQNASLAVLPFGLLTHNGALLALACLGFGAGCLALPLPPMEHTEMRRLLPLAERLIGKESAWLAKPLDRRKKWQLILWGLGAPLAGWLLWEQDLGPIGLVIALLYLLRVRRENIKSGIDP